MSEEIKVELSKDLLKAIEGHRGNLSVSEFIEVGMRWATMRPKLKLNTEELKKRW